MRRLLALVVLAALGYALFHHWNTTGGVLPAADSATLSNTVDSVGDTLRSTRTAGSVKAALELNRTLADAPIDVDASGDVVILRGEVPTPETRMLAETVAASVPGVASVRNELRVSAGSPASSADARTLGENVDDRAMEGKVRLAFSLNRALSGSDISVTSYRRAVTLAGEVASETQREAALLVARDIPGVTSVVDRVQVRGGAGAPPLEGASPAAPGSAGVPAGGTGAGTSPVAAGAIEQALATSSSLSAYGLKVRNDGGRLVLTGSVRTPAERELAGLLARDAARTEVTNAVEIRP